MKTYKIDSAEFDTPDSEQEIEVVVTTSNDAQRFPTLAKFADEVGGEGTARKLGPPVAFAASPSFEQERLNLRRVAGLEVPTNCSWPYYVIADDWNWRHTLLDAGSAFISYRGPRRRSGAAR